MSVEASPREPVSARGGIAAFFTAGVDSFYTALKHADEIETLVYVHGFDVELGRPDVRQTVIQGIRGAAAGLGKSLLELETNLAQAFSPHFLSWGTYHGAALGSVAALVGSRFRRVYVPSSYSYSHLRPWGSHPLLDPLWSTDEIELVHDGCEVTRTEKVRVIADNPAANKWLRVCMENPGGAYNCSSCDKCLRTMVILRSMGRLESFKSFPPLDVGNMRFAFRPRVPEDSWQRSWSEILAMVEAAGTDKELEAGVRKLLEIEMRQGES